MSAIREYGVAVLDGKIKACKRIKQLYERLLFDLENPGAYHFDEELAQRHIEFIERFCKQSQGKIGQPIKLELFQRAMLEAVFGFVDDEGIRKYNELLCILGRKNGKTTLMSCIELDLLINDKEGAPEIYNIATKLEQAKKGFDEARNMVNHSPSLSSLIKPRRVDLYCTYNLGSIRALASNANGMDGLNSHGVIIDELHAIKNRDLYDLMKQSMSARRQPLLACITTNGFIRNGIYDAQYDYACGVLDGVIDNEHFLPVIYELDDEAEWKKEDCWIKANPGLGTIKSLQYLRECVQKAKDDPSFKPTVLTKDFNLKQTEAAAWLKWDEINNEDTFDISAFDYCIGGFDAADKVDLNAATALFMRPGDDHIYRKSMYWIPEDVLRQEELSGSRQERDNAPYRLWIEQGYMRTCPGNKCDKQIFLDWFIELRDSLDIYTLYIGYDPWHIDDSLLRAFKSEFGEQSMIPVRQGVVTLSQPMMDLRADLAAHRLIYNNNPIDKWCLLNTCVKQDINGNIQPVKMLDRRRRIDGTVALLNAYKILMDKKDQFVELNKGVN